MTTMTEQNLMRGLGNGTSDRMISVLKEHGELSLGEMIARGVPKGSAERALRLLLAQHRLNVRTTGDRKTVIEKRYSLK